MVKKSNAVQEQLGHVVGFLNKNRNQIQSSQQEGVSKIKEMRAKLSDKLVEMGKSQIAELDAVVATTQETINAEIEQCITNINDLDGLTKKLELTDNQTNEVKAFVGMTRFQELVSNISLHTNEILDKGKYDVSFTRNNEALKSICSIKRFGQIMTNRRRRTISTTLAKDLLSPCIQGVCVMSNGRVVVIDMNNKTIKLLNHKYEVVADLVLMKEPTDVCCIEGNQILACAGNELIFVMVERENMTEIKRVSLNHRCVGVTSHGNEVYVTSGCALYLYKSSGDLVKMIYNDQSKAPTVQKCAVSSDGQFIYITNLTKSKVFVIDRGGQNISEFVDNEMVKPEDVCVTVEGHVFVCSYQSDTVIQLDALCKKKIKTIATYSDGVYQPNCIVFRQDKRVLLVGCDQLFLEIKLH